MIIAMLEKISNSSESDHFMKDRFRFAGQWKNSINLMFLYCYKDILGCNLEHSIYYKKRGW